MTHSFTIEEVNLDGMTVSNIHEFIDFVGNGVRPIAAARQLFPDHKQGAVLAVKALRNYAWNKITAMECRTEGKIAAALQYERICDRIYSELPKWASW